MQRNAACAAVRARCARPLSHKATKLDRADRCRPTPGQKARVLVSAATTCIKQPNAFTFPRRSGFTAGADATACYCSQLPWASAFQLSATLRCAQQQPGVLSGAASLLASCRGASGEGAGVGKINTKPFNQSRQRPGICRRSPMHPRLTDAPSQAVARTQARV